MSASSGARPGRAVHRRRIALALGALALAGWLAFAGWTMLRAHTEIEAGRNQVRAVQVLDASQLLDGTADAELAGAHEHFDGAVHRLGNPIVSWARVLPWAGRQLQSVTALATSAREATAMARSSLVRIDDSVGDGVPAGPARPVALQNVAEAAGDLRSGLAGLDLGPDRALIGKLADARAEFTREIDDLSGRLGDLEAVTAGLADVLDGPHRYLVLAANNAQMQNGHGMFLDYTVAETSGGELHLGEFNSTVDLPSPAQPVELDPDIAASWPWMDPNDDWRHLGTTARFPATAATAQRMWAAIGRPPVDGVLAIDAVALRALLSLTGPVSVDAGVNGAATVDAESVEAYLLHDQYREFFGDGATTDAAQQARENRLRAVARAALDAVTGAGTPMDLSALGIAGQTLQQRHLLAWSSIPEQQEAFEAAGIDGTVPADGVLVSVVNRGGNKLDWFLDVSSSVEVEPSTSPEAGADVVTLTVSLHNGVDPSVEPNYVVGPYEEGLSAGQYLGVVTATIPGVATDVTVEGAPAVVAGRDGESLLYGARVLVDPGGDASVVFRFSIRPDEMPVLILQASGRVHGVDWLVDGAPPVDDTVTLIDP